MSTSNLSQGRFYITNIPVGASLAVDSISIKEYNPKITISQNGFLISVSKNSYFKISNGLIDINFPKIKMNTLNISNKLFFGSETGSTYFKKILPDTIQVFDNFSINGNLSVGNGGTIFLATINAYPNTNDVASFAAYASGTLIPSIYVSAASGSVSTAQKVRIGIGTLSSQAELHISGSTNNETLFRIDNNLATSIFSVSSSNRIFITSSLVSISGSITACNVGATTPTNAAGVLWLDTSASGNATQSYNISIISSSYTATLSDQVLLCSGTFIVSLPSATTPGKYYHIKNRDGGVITVSASLTNNIDNNSTQILTSYSSLHIVSDGILTWSIL